MEPLVLYSRDISTACGPVNIYSAGHIYRTNTRWCIMIPPPEYVRAAEQQSRSSRHVQCLVCPSQNEPGTPKTLVSWSRRTCECITDSFCIASSPPSSLFIPRGGRAGGSESEQGGKAVQWLERMREREGEEHVRLASSQSLQQTNFQGEIAIIEWFLHFVIKNRGITLANRHA